MKHYLLFSIILLGGLFFNSCGSSKSVEKSPIKTFVMPCSELTSSNGVLRAWASGKSDNETTARKKAQVAASADLAAALSKTVEVTTEDYTSALTEGTLKAQSKSFLNDKTKVVVNKTLTNATIACDRWTKDEATGIYTNYIVLQIDGEDYLKLLYEELRKNTSISIDEELLEKLFLKNINESGKSK